MKHCFTTVRKISRKMSKETNVYIKWMDTCIKTRVLTFCCYAGSGEEGVMEDVKRKQYMYLNWMDT